MEVIIKPTSRCNFNCTFCSSSCMNLLHQNVLHPKIAQQLKILQPTNIIVTGGEPLMVSLQFYYDLLKLGNWRVSITSNLKDYMLNPDKWKQLFKNERIGVCTSFQYGNERKWNEQTSYDEHMFEQVFNKFYVDIGYKLQFIAVISNSNEQFALDHLKLAKRLGTKCKLNGVMPLGKSTDFYPQHKLIKLWLDAIDQGYKQYMNMDICFNGGCNLNTNMLCESTIRSCAMSEDGKLLYSNCEDDLTIGKYINVDTKKIQQTKGKLNILDYVTKDCIFCELFYICNGCKQNRKINKRTKDHCKQMKAMKDRILKSNIRIQP